MSHPIYCARCARQFQSRRHVICEVCRHEPAKSKTLGPSFALRGGEWVVRGGIKVWVPWPDSERWAS